LDGDHNKGTFFGDYAWFFHLLKMNNLEDLVKAFQRYDQALKTCNARCILDIGCGTGVFAPFFIDDGYSYVGIDASDSMLAIAREHEPRGQYVLGDMRRLELNALPSTIPFDAVTCMGRTLCHLIHDADIEACIASAFQVLKPGGMFACDVANAQIAQNHTGEHFCDTVQVEGGTVQRDIIFNENHFQDTGKSLNIQVHAIVDLKCRKIELVDYVYNLRSFMPEEMRAFLENAGFGRISVIIYARTKQSLFVTAEKP